MRRAQFPVHRPIGGLNEGKRYDVMQWTPFDTASISYQRGLAMAVRIMTLLTALLGAMAIVFGAPQKRKFGR